MKKLRRRQDLSYKIRRRPYFWTKSSWVLCPVNAVCNLFSMILVEVLANWTKQTSDLMSVWSSWRVLQLRS